MSLNIWFSLTLPPKKERRPCLQVMVEFQVLHLASPDLGRAFYLFWVWVRVLIPMMPPWDVCVDCLICAPYVVSENTRLWGRLSHYWWAVVNVYSRPTLTPLSWCLMRSSPGCLCDLHRGEDGGSLLPGRDKISGSYVFFFFFRFFCLSRPDVT